MTKPAILTLNAGSSSLKFALFSTASPEPARMAMGRIERIGAAPRLDADFGADLGPDTLARDLEPGEAADHAAALGTALALLRGRFPGVRVQAVGHRVVHGGPGFQGPAAIDTGVMAEISRLAPYAPLHQPHNIAGIEAARAAFPDALQVACFDTAFHRTQPKVNDVFAIPRAYYDKGIRRYGFHGLSYDYLAGELARGEPELHAGRVVVAHLGNGASMCGLLGGRSIASTMGFTALDGLPMGTRCGQIDPGVLLYMMAQEGMSVAEVSALLYTGSGLLGLSGLSNDMRTLEAAATSEAEEAIDHFVARIRHELGGLAAALGGLDALVFSGGIGENSPLVRARACTGMAWLGLALDPDRNAANARVVSAPDSRVKIMVIPTDEELVIARAALGLLEPGPAAPA